MLFDILISYVELIVGGNSGAPDLTVYSYYNTYIYHFDTSDQRSLRDSSSNRCYTVIVDSQDIVIQESSED